MKTDTDKKLIKIIEYAIENDEAETLEKVIEILQRKIKLIREAEILFKNNQPYAKQNQKIHK